MIERKEPKGLEAKLQEIAKLKVESSKVHLKCISQTTAILTEEQVVYLLPFWE